MKTLLDAIALQVLPSIASRHASPAAIAKKAYDIAKAVIAEGERRNQHKDSQP